MKSLIGKLINKQTGTLLIPSTISQALNTLLHQNKPQKEDIKRLTAALNSTAALPITEKYVKKEHLDDEEDYDTQFTTIKKPLKTTLPPVLPHVLQYGPRESSAYLSLRFCPSYIAVQAILNELKTRLPRFSPKTMLDYGCGPGSAIWAARDTFYLENVLGIDISQDMLRLTEAFNGITIDKY